MTVVTFTINKPHMPLRLYSKNKSISVIWASQLCPNTVSTVSITSNFRIPAASPPNARYMDHIIWEATDTELQPNINSEDGLVLWNPFTHTLKELRKSLLRTQC